MNTVVHIITGLEEGGAEAVLYRLCISDPADRHHVISLGGGGKYGAMLEQAGIPVTFLEMPRGHVTVRGFLQLWKALREIRPTAVQTWMYHANLLGGIVARLAGQRNIYWGIRQTGLDPKRASRSTMLVHRLSAHLSRYIPRAIVCCAERARDFHARDGYDVRRMVVIPNGYDLLAFRPDAAAAAAFRGELEIDEGTPLIGFVARFHPIKDHPNLLHALARLRDLPGRPLCLLVGKGMEQSNMELAKLIADLELTDMVRLLGPRHDIPAVMNGLDVHVMSSASEGFPNVLAEAMACGTPCVATDVGDAALIVGETGRIVPPGDPIALAKAVEVTLTELPDPAWIKKKEEARNRVASNFTLGLMVDRYRQLWFGGSP